VIRPVLIALGAAMLAGCGTFSSNDAAADVDGDEILRDEFEELMQTFTANSEITQITGDLATGTVPSDQARGLLGLLVVNTANRSFLESHGESITDADRDEFVQTVQGNPLLELPDHIVNELVDSQVGATARGRIAAPASAELEELYTESPTAAGVMCLRRIVVDSEAAADDVLDELEGGADFAALAEERSTDEVSAAEGGAVTSPEGEGCVPLTQATSAVDAAVVEAAMESRPGVAIGPIETPSGWEVVEARPYDDIGDSLGALYGDRAGDLLFFGHLATADIEVDPRYGRWDPVAFSVVGLQ
jgi:PPIC-type PPIASE domain